MTTLEVVSLLWCAFFGAVLLGVIVSAVIMAVDESREKKSEEKEQ